MDVWEIKVRTKTYRLKASTNAEARWAGARKYYLETNTDMTISMLYQLASCYRVYGRKEIPW